MNSKLIQKIAGLSGMAAQLVYTVMWIIGGFFYPGYSHIVDDVSTLMSLGAPTKLFCDILNITSTLLGVVFYVGFLISFKKRKRPILGPIFLVLLGICGILVSFFFPLDEGGEITSISGMLHFILVMCMPVLTMGTTLVMWRGAKKIEGWEIYSRYSLISFFLILVCGLFAVFTIGTDLMGLGERLGVVATQQFFFGIALKLFKETR